MTPPSLRTAPTPMRPHVALRNRRSAQAHGILLRTLGRSAADAYAASAEAPSAHRLPTQPSR